MTPTVDRGAPFGLLIEPDAREWAGAVRGFFRADDPLRQQSRRALGLPIDRPVVMTGHQAMLWHPGILAKYLAADSAARAMSAASAWLVVDQDSEDPFHVAYPALRASGEFAGRVANGQSRVAGLGRAAIEFPAVSAPTDTPAASLNATAPRAPSATPRGANPEITERLAAIRAAFEAHRNAKNAGHQLAGVLADLLAPLAPVATIFATSLNTTPIFASLVRDMREFPERCVRAYNAAVARHPEAKLRPLICDDVNVRYELPLWRLRLGMARAPVFAEDLETLALSELAPKALLMTGLLRATACDLFIHGKGGGVYDVVTSEWFDQWRPGLRLAPTSVASATLTLPLLLGAGVTDADVAGARWMVHHARHDPAMMGDTEAATVKSDLVRTIVVEKEHGRDPRPFYRQLHALLERVRQERRTTLHGIEQEAAQISARASDAELAADRTWPFALYPASQLRELVRMIEARF